MNKAYTPNGALSSKSSKSSLVCRLLMISLFAFAGPSSGTAADSPLSDKPVFTPRDNPVVAPALQNTLNDASQSRAKLWVFFTDKGVYDQSSFARAAARVTLSDKVRSRRAKTGTDRVMFVDLPVLPDYISKIESLGGKLRCASRYLNAASFDLPIDRLDSVSALPFVARIKPVMEFIRPPDTMPPDQETAELTARVAPDALNYGSSFSQLNAIKVPAAHAKGFNGQGVTLAIFDTGFRKSHQAFANAYAENRVLGEYDFVFNDHNTANESADVSGQWNHGTSTWSLSGGLSDGKLYGPAYKANFLLAKTEDIRTEKHIEEDNWIRALEWADSMGVDVVTSSVSYKQFDSGISYTYADMNGLTAPITIAASTADSLGIIICNSMGNDGPAAGTIHVPSDAFGILAVGSVMANGSISSSSSRGPTFDGRTKPEICAMGVSTYAANTTSDVSFSLGFSGTSAATPIAAGAVCLMVQARPTFPPSLIRQAIKETASNAINPDNTYGWGIVNIDSALSWGVGFASNVRVGAAPLTVHFTNMSQLSGDSIRWDFGDGSSSVEQNPDHEFVLPGRYAITLTNHTSYGSLTKSKADFIVATADTLRFGADSAFAGQKLVKSLILTNSQPLTSFLVPFGFELSPLHITVDSITLGARTSYFERVDYLTYDQTNNQYALDLIADNGGGSPDLPSGTGEIARVYLGIDKYDLGGLQNAVDTVSLTDRPLLATSAAATYVPVVVPGTVGTKSVMRADFNRTFFIDLSDLSALIAFLTGYGGPPATIQCGDFNANRVIDLSDLSSLVSYLTTGAPLPVYP